MSQLDVKYVPVKDLIPYANNARTHDDLQVSQIAASIKEFGFNNPVLLDEHSGIIAGHGRVLAAKKLKIDKVPTIKLSHLTEQQRKGYIIADNQLAMNSNWDLDLLGLELETLSKEDFDMALLGFDTKELDKYLNGSPELQNNSKELGEEDFDKLAHECPKCGFEFD